MKVRMLEDCGWCDGIRLATGLEVDLSETAAKDYIALGKAVAVEVEEPKAPIETAVVAPPENAAVRTRKPTARKAGAK